MVGRPQVRSLGGWHKLALYLSTCSQTLSSLYVCRYACMYARTHTRLFFPADTKCFQVPPTIQPPTGLSCLLALRTYSQLRRMRMPTLVRHRAARWRRKHVLARKRIGDGRGGTGASWTTRERIIGRSVTSCKPLPPCSIAGWRVLRMSPTRSSSAMLTGRSNVCDVSARIGRRTGRHAGYLTPAAPPCSLDGVPGHGRLCSRVGGGLFNPS